MSKDYETSKPIYMQIVEKIIREIIRDERKPGDKLPSVREMAIESGVNPNTIQRTYGELEQMGIVESKRGQGTFIVNDDEKMNTLKKQSQNEIIKRFILDMHELGVSDEQIKDDIHRYLEGRENK